jgi:mlo protein
MGIIDGSLLRRLICLCLWCLLGGGVTVVTAEDEKKVVHKQLNQTPTWAVAAVCTFFIVVSVLLEKLLHKVGKVCSFFSGFLLNLCTFVVCVEFEGILEMGSV